MWTSSVDRMLTIERARIKDAVGLAEFAHLIETNAGAGHEDDQGHER